MSATVSVRASTTSAFTGTATRAERNLRRFILGSVLVHSVPLLTLLPFAFAPEPISRSLASAASDVSVDVSARADEPIAAAPEPLKGAPHEPDLGSSLTLSPEPAPRARKKKHKPKASDATPQSQVVPSTTSETVDAGADAAPGRLAIASDGGGSSIELVLHADRLREHALGARLLPLAAWVAGWRALFHAARIDPRTGVDRILIHGADLRDSRTLAAAFTLSSREARSAEEALGKLVGGDAEHGHWLDAGVLAAEAGEGDAERVYASPAPGVVVVAPSELLARALHLGQTADRGTAPPGELAVLSVQSPFRFGQGLGLDLPRGITWLRANLVSDADGLVSIDVRAGAENAEIARELAVGLERVASFLGERASSAIAPSPLSKFSGRHAKAKDLVERSELSPHNTRVVGRIVLRREALEALVELAEKNRNEQ